MTQVDELSHPAVELPLPLDGATHEMDVPRETALFFWTALAVGTPDRLPPVRSSLGNSLFNVSVKAQERMSWAVSVDGASIPLLADSYYREGGYTGLAWWTACEPVGLPVSVRIQFKAEGEIPTYHGDQIVLWTRDGRSIPWDSTIESALELTPSECSPSEFPTRKERLWKQRTVYTPR